MGIADQFIVGKHPNKAFIDQVSVQVTKVVGRQVPIKGTIKTLTQWALVYDADRNSIWLEGHKAGDCVRVSLGVLQISLKEPKHYAANLLVLTVEGWYELDKEESLEAASITLRVMHDRSRQTALSADVFYDELVTDEDMRAHNKRALEEIDLL